MKQSTYEEWLNRDDLAPLELALLMADTCPDWGLAKEILEVCESDDPVIYQQFAIKYRDMPGQWAYFEKFERSRAHIFTSQRVGDLAKKALPNGRIPRDVAVDFVLRLDVQPQLNGDTYTTFLRAAMGTQANKLAAIADTATKPWWRQDHDVEDMILTKAALYREKRINLTRGNPSKEKLSEEIARAINMIEASKKTGRTIGRESIRNFLKNRKI